MLLYLWVYCDYFCVCRLLRHFSIHFLILSSSLPFFISLFFSLIDFVCCVRFKNLLLMVGNLSLRLQLKRLFMHKHNSMVSVCVFSLVFCVGFYWVFVELTYEIGSVARTFSNFNLFVVV